MKIDFANLNMHYDLNHDKFDKAIKNVLSSGKFILGDEVQLLEKNLTKFNKSKYCITCSNGTVALSLALMALEIGPGDEVITTPFTFISTAETIALSGAKPIFVDIDPKTFNIDPNLIEQSITKNTKAIIPVSLFGLAANMKLINKIANKYNITVIEDGAQSFGAMIDDRYSCNLSTLATTSFFPAKPLGCFGDGGAVFTNDSSLYEKIKSLRVHGQTKKYYHEHIGLGARLNTIQASVLNVKLSYYKKTIKQRQKVASNYSENIRAERFQLPFVPNGYSSVWAQYCLLDDSRTQTMEKLNSIGIPTTIYYPLPLHLQKCFSYLNYKKGCLPLSESISKKIMSIPMNPFMTDYEIEYVVEALNKL